MSLPNVLAVTIFVLSFFVDVFSNKIARIINGMNAVPNMWRFMVGLSFQKRPKTADSLINCGGTILNSHHILTAAHCLSGRLIDSITVFGGNVNISTNGNSLSVKEWIIHPDFNERTFMNDIAILRLEEGIDFCEKKELSCIERLSKGEQILSDKCIVMGWGTRDKNKSEGSPLLQELVVPILSDDICAAFDPTMDSERALCAGYLEGGRDHCLGDSGGPLICPVERRNGFYVFVQYGIVSYGTDCGAPYDPGYYTKLESFWSWIDENSIR